MLDDLGFAGSRIEPASSDASFRRYFRVTRGADSYIVMDAPPDKESLLPFIGVAHVAYLTNGRVVGLSKIPRLIQAMASRPVVASFACAKMVTSSPSALRSSSATRALMTPFCSSC